jgi:hypothetical protein
MVIKHQNAVLAELELEESMSELMIGQRRYMTGSVWFGK